METLEEVGMVVWDIDLQSCHTHPVDRHPNAFDNNQVFSIEYVRIPSGAIELLLTSGFPAFWAS